MRNRIRQRTILSLALWLIVSALIVSAQDARESLGPKDKPSQAKGPHPLTQLMATLNSSLRPELRGKHPRVYVTETEIVKLRERARTTHRDLWQRALRQVRALKKEAPAPPAQERRAQNEVGIGIAEATLAYKIEGDRKYLEGIFGRLRSCTPTWPRRSRCRLHSARGAPARAARAPPSLTREPAAARAAKDRDASSAPALAVSRSRFPSHKRGGVCLAVLAAATN